MVEAMVMAGLEAIGAEKSGIKAVSMSFED